MHELAGSDLASRMYASVYIQTRHNGHTQVAIAKEACLSYGVPYHLLSVPMKSRLKSEGLEGQMKRRDNVVPAAGE